MGGLDDAIAQISDIITKINESGVPISATVLNTGSGGNPYRINFTSSVTGRNGEMIIDSGGFNLGLSTLSRGQDAKVLVGGGEGSGSDGFLVTSPTNTLSNVIPNVSIDLHAASSDTVSVTISRDESKIIAAVEKFVEAFNSTISRIDEYDFYDVDKEQRGILLGNPTAARIRASLINTVRQSAEGVDSEFQFLRQVGIRIGDITLNQIEPGRTTEEWLIAILGEPTSRAPVDGLPNVEVLRYTTAESPSGIASFLPGQGGREVATTYFVLLDGVVEKFWQDRPTESGLFAKDQSAGSKVEEAAGN